MNPRVIFFGCLAALVVGAVLLPGCQGFRSFWTGLKNEDLGGKTAPTLASTTWIAPGGERTTSPPPAKWQLIAFFLPH